MEQVDIELDSKKAFDFDIECALEDFVVDHTSFYHIYVWDDKITIEEQGYNTPTIKKVVFETKKLVNNMIVKQKRDAIVSIYQYTFLKNGELASRISMIMENPKADSHWGASHTFYHDRTGKYPEYTIVKRVILLNGEKSLEEDSQTNRFHR